MIILSRFLKNVKKVGHRLDVAPLKIRKFLFVLYSIMFLETSQLKC